MRAEGVEPGTRARRRPIPAVNEKKPHCFDPLGLSLVSSLKFDRPLLGPLTRRVLPLLQERILKRVRAGGKLLRPPYNIVESVPKYLHHHGQVRPSFSKVVDP